MCSTLLKRSPKAILTNLRYFKIITTIVFVLSIIWGKVDHLLPSPLL